MGIPAIISLLPSVISTGTDLYRYVMRIRDEAKRRGEWTESEELAFKARLNDASQLDHWKPEL
jgi:hypothetical protein